MKLNIFLPEAIYREKLNDCELFGENLIDENLISYFIVPNPEEHSKRLGVITNVRKTNENKIVLSFDESGEIFLHSTSIYSVEDIQCNFYIYDDQNISVEDGELKATSSYGDVMGFLKILSNIRYTVQEILIFIIKIGFKPIELVVPKNKVEKALSNYSLMKSSKKSDEKRELVDLIVGLGLMWFILSWYKHGEYVLDATQEVIFHLRFLLQSLKGNPIGLKLNFQLNNFLLDCFTYHIDLWSTFIAITSPFIQILLIPIAVAGIFGISCQLALLSDLLNLVTLHAHYFYIYTSVLFNIEKIGLKTLWKMAVGRRINSLKNRTESLEQMNQQWYITVLFLTCLLFLMPTILLYYVVFSSIRFAIWIIDMILYKSKNFFKEFPFDDYVHWFLGTYKAIEGIDITFKGIVCKNGLPKSTIFLMSLRKTFPKKRKYGF